MSRLRWLFVIARNSSFTYRDRAMDVRQIGRELGRALHPGRQRAQGGEHACASPASCIDVSTGAHLWAERFDGTLEEVFDLQDQVATKVVGAIAPKLEQAEIERAKRKPTESLDAYDHFPARLGLRVSLDQTNRWKRRSNTFGRAIELDPDYASAYGMAARCYSARKVSGWMEDNARRDGGGGTAGEEGRADRPRRCGSALHCRHGARLITSANSMTARR